MLPFLFAAYLFMEYLEHRASDKMRRGLSRFGRLGPLGGAVLGVVPQCGFSVAAANCYAGRILTPGTLLAVFLSTSDQALVILLMHPDMLGYILPMIGIKVLSAVVFGFLLDAVLLRGKGQAEAAGFDDLCTDCDCGHNGIFRAALHHTGGIFFFILAVNVALGFGMELLGAERISTFLLNGSVLQPFLTALIGLIPNCAVSVLLAELFAAGSLRFGALLSGLCAGAGVGLVVLFRMNRRLKENLLFLTALYAASVATGLLTDLFTAF